jgi:hypothetical protein
LPVPATRFPRTRTGQFPTLTLLSQIRSQGGPIGTPCPKALLALAVSQPSGRFFVEPGSDLGSRYHIESLLGEGGMGSVYRAYDRELDRTVAIKVIRPGLVADPSAVQRFKQELLLGRRSRTNTFSASTTWEKSTASSSSPWPSWMARICTASSAARAGCRSIAPSTIGRQIAEALGRRSRWKASSIAI